MTVACVNTTLIISDPALILVKSTCDWVAQFNFEPLTITVSALFSQFATKFVGHLPNPYLNSLSTILAD